MKKKKIHSFLIFIILIILLAFAGCTAATEDNDTGQMSSVRYYTEEYPPLNFEEKRPD
ncbi:hypothetical protein [Methanoplanus limicola]|uniref:Lipoprotein n=1 Tax=Methanoplanus limicola DSM 2279 TaxID=937775 RepID=H1Z398_9EURY|nr:hypothetical protein [Methanoplanus limicola]EHQ36513.1 hypothetical protein Metlim_2466 [Methanoplanus limicola DSM 2279]